MCEGCSAGTLTFAAAAQAAAKSPARDWTRGSILSAGKAVSELTVAAPSAPRAMPAPLSLIAPHTSTPSRRRIESSVTAVTWRVLTGFLPDAPVGVPWVFNNAATREAHMAKAVRGAEDVFNAYAHSSSRARALSASASDADWSSIAPRALARARLPEQCTCEIVLLHRFPQLRTRMWRLPESY